MRAEIHEGGKCVRVLEVKALTDGPPYVLSTIKRHVRDTRLRMPWKMFDEVVEYEHWRLRETRSDGVAIYER